MKLLIGVVLVLVTAMAANATAGDLFSKKARVADAADVCLANCSSQDAACRRVCPTTFNVPCLNSCDSQTQSCRQGCQRK